MNTRRCCFLSMDSLEGYTQDDDLAIPPLEKLGWNVDVVSWRDTAADWNDFEAVVIRTPWDYQNSPDDFLTVLASIDASDALLLNPLSTVRWNLDKSYLNEMAAAGVRIVPTLWERRMPTSDLFCKWQNVLGSQELVVKPTVSATAQDTFRLIGYDPHLAQTFPDGRSYMVQPFAERIVSEGEFSLFYFGGDYSHAIRKVPKSGDYRVQEEHGGIISAVEPQAEMMAIANGISATLPDDTLYARIDLVPDDAGDLMLMELELIEPALYFRTDADSAERFARKFHERLNEL